MQSSTQHTISSSAHQSSTLILRTNGSQSTGRAIQRQLQQQSSNGPQMWVRQKQQLLMRVLMMLFEIQRKDVVVKNLIRDVEALESRNSLVVGGEVHVAREELAKAKRHIQQLQHKVAQLQLVNSQLSLSRTSISKQVEQKLHTIEHRSKQLQIKKIELESQLHHQQTQNKMLTFKIVNVESTQKSKCRQMQSIIYELEKRVVEQRKVSEQLKIIIQTSHEQIRGLKQNQHRLCRQFQEQVVLMKKEWSHNEDLKRSQVMMGQQKVQMTQNQLLRMQQQVKFMRKKLDEQQLALDRGKNQLLAEVKRGKDIQGELLRLRHINQQLKEELQQRNGHVNNLLREVNEAHAAYNALEESRQVSSLEAVTTYEQQMTLAQQQTQIYRQRMATLQQQLQRYRSQARRLKRKSQNMSTQCTSCKIIQSSTSIKSHRAINDLNLSEIIQQTEKLHDSSLKMEQILSSKRIVIMGSAYDSRMSIDNSFVE